MTQGQVTIRLNDWERAMILDGIEALREKMRATDAEGHALTMASGSILAAKLDRVFKHKGKIVIAPRNI